MEAIRQKKNAHIGFIIPERNKNKIMSIFMALCKASILEANLQYFDHKYSVCNCHIDILNQSALCFEPGDILPHHIHQDWY